MTLRASIVWGVLAGLMTLGVLAPAKAQGESVDAKAQGESVAAEVDAESVKGGDTSGSEKPSAEDEQKVDPDAEVLPEPESSTPTSSTSTAKEGSRSGAGAQREESLQKDPGLELASLDSVVILARAEEVSLELKELEEILRIPEELAILRKELAADEEELRVVVAEARKDIALASRWFLISDIQFGFRERLLLLDEKRGPLDHFSGRVGNTPKKVEAILIEWTKARSVLSKVGSPAPVLDRVDRLLRSAQLLNLRLSRAEAALVRTGAYFERMKATIEGLLNVSETEAPSLLRDFSHRSQVPEGSVSLSLSDNWLAVQEAFRGHQQLLREFVAVSGSRLIFHFLYLSVLVFSLIKGRGFYRSRDGEDVASQHLVLRHPWAGALLIAAVSTIWIHPISPAIVGLIAMFGAIFAASFLLLDEGTHENRLLVFGSWLLLLFLGAHMQLARAVAVERWFLASEGLAVVFLIFQFSRSKAMQWDGIWRTMARMAVRVWAGAAALGLICWFADFDRSTSILIDGTARLMLVTVAFRVCYEVLASIIVLGAQSPWALSFHAFAHHGALIAQRVNFVLRWVLAFYWFGAALRSYAVHSSATSAYEDLLEQELSVGSISLQLGSLAILGIGIALAVYASRFTRFLLEEEVLPRTTMSIGSRAAITSGAGYVILGFGMFTALAAVGFELDKIAILVSALGVGIGFGLQNIVQNFVAGIILIFGRPINVGDRVEVGGLLGTVTEVGFRASTVHTIQGAEVIVPNSQFVADQVINWSLSDDRRRIEVDVGVKYGTDPQRVLDILAAAADEHALVISDPAPEAIFIEFGDNSLNFQLRAWTDEGRNWIVIRSDLSIAIDKALKEADIEIPFPQRDLHLRSVDQDAARALFVRSEKKAES